MGNYNLVFCCSKDNDLYLVTQKQGFAFKRSNNLRQIVEYAEDNSGILVLADEYPKQSLEIDAEILQTAEKKKLRLYVEYPLSLQGCKLGEPQDTKYERLIVSSEFFGDSLENNSIMMLNGCWYLPADAGEHHLCMAKAAGYDKLAFGLPEKIYPILFNLPENSNIMVATSCLSRFVTARYAPYTSWKKVWEKLLSWLTYDRLQFNLDWTPVVGPSYGKKDPLPLDSEKYAAEKSFSWFYKNAVYSVDHKKGVIEGFESGIDPNGRQLQRNNVRGDCNAEAAMVVALDWYLNGGPQKKRLCKQMCDYVWSSPDFYQDDPESPLYGLSNWYVNGPVFYGDDNARVILPSLLAASLLSDSSWDDRILRCLLANLRTSNMLGFRRHRLENSSFIPQKRNWTYYMNENDYTLFQPHYEAFLWAAFIWAYSLTGYDEFLSRTKTAIKMTMEVYPDGLKWTNSLTAEMTRMLLPLSFLVKIEDTKEHREWLNRVVDDVISYMDESGAIQDMFGNIKMGDYPPPQSNEKYGTTEASLIQNSGDTATDLLYTTNWAFLGLHEAALATGDQRIKEAEDRLAEFLCRIQVKSELHSYLDGAWMRSFDFKKWEYWGSSADIGWGAWCVESGWTNTWIASVLALRQKGESLFNLSASDRFRAISPAIIQEMFTEKPLKEV